MGGPRNHKAGLRAERSSHPRGSETVGLIVPLRLDGAERDRNWSWLEARYRRTFPEWEIAVGRHDEGPWCKGAAVRDALSRTSAARLIISDADMILDDDYMVRGVDGLDDYKWVVPHRRAYRLTKDASAQFMAGTLTWEQTTHDHLEMPPRAMYRCGGLFFIRREVYEDVAFDERFRGWGGEDEALGKALTTLHGEPLLLDHYLLHLYHSPQAEMPADRLRPKHADALVKRYEAAQNDPKAMRRLLDEHSDRRAISA